MTRIEGKVAELLSERDLVINRGAAEGVEIGMRFKILHPRGNEVRDPDTNEVIGNVEWPKVEVKVVSVQEHLSVARTFRTIEIPASGQRSIIDYIGRDGFGGIYKPASQRTETLRSDEPFAQRDIEPWQSYVQRGDPAVQIVARKGDIEY